MSEVYIVGGVTLLVFCIGFLVNIDKVLNKPINKTDEQIKNILRSINPDSSDLSKIIDIVCALQRRKKHLYKDIQNTLSLWIIASILLIIISLESIFNINNDFFKTLIQSIGLLILLLILSGLCYITRFLIEIRKISKIE